VLAVITARPVVLVKTAGCSVVTSTLNAA